MHVSHLEGIIARGDIRVGELIEKAWRGGARFDGWDDQLQWDAWQAALSEWENEEGLSRQVFLDTVPVDGRLPWDHIDVGLEDGFLLREYQKALKSRLSPPCGKPFRAKVHHTNVAEHEADERRLICYDCGIACDMSKMRTDRRTFLERLGALEPGPASLNGPTRTQTAVQRHKAGLSPHDFVQGEKVRYRLRYTKLGPVSLQGHLDMVRILPRMLVRAGHMPFYSRGFSPKPSLSFGPALGLGARAWGEFVDVGLSGCEPTPKALLDGLNTVAPEGLLVTGVRRLREGDLGASKVISSLEYVVVLSEPRELLAARLDEARAQQVLPIEVRRKGKTRELDLWSVVDRVELVDPSTLGLEDQQAKRTALCFRQPFGIGATLKPHEVASAITGTEVSTRQVLRIRCVALDEAGARTSPLRVGLVDAADIAEASHEQADLLRKQATPPRDDLAELVPDAPPRLLEIAGA